MTFINSGDVSEVFDWALENEQKFGGMVLYFQKS